MTARRRFTALIAAALLGGCSAGPPRSADFDVPAGQYTKAFDESRDVLASYRFSLERVDAAAGVVATTPKTTAGLATPWDQEQTTFEQDMSDLVNHQQRTVRVTFEAPGGEGAGTPDLRTTSGPVHAHVEVVIERTRRPGWRLDTTALRLSSFTHDPELDARGMWPRYTVVVAQDPLLAGRVAADIRKRLGLPEPGVEPVKKPKGDQKPAPHWTGEPGM